MKILKAVGIISALRPLLRQALFCLPFHMPREKMTESPVLRCGRQEKALSALSTASGIMPRSTACQRTAVRLPGLPVPPKKALSCTAASVRRPWRCRLQLLEHICREFFQNRENAEAFRTLFWGRLEPDTPNGSRELSLRLALAAHQSPDWDARRGRPRSGDFNGFVKALANSALIYPELKELFEHFHKTLRFSCAEKVLVMEAGKLPFYEQLKQHGVKASERLPFDCMAWFSVTDGAAR